MLYLLTLLLLALCNPCTSTLQVVPGATWTAAGTNEHVQAHGGGIVQLDGVFYWIGENKFNGSAFQSVNCYSSTDLVNWTFNNTLLTRQPDGDLGPNRVIERPKVMYNDETKLWVMWLHVDNSSYAEAKTGVATCASICGDYEYRGSSRPLGFQSRDMSIFKDTDGTGYLLTEDREEGLRIEKLSADYLTAEVTTFLFEDYTEAPTMTESPAMYKSGDTYFMFASRQSGWDPNDNIYCTATNISGPWSEWNLFAPNGTKTFRSQTTYVANINGIAMFMGDRWNGTRLSTSTYVWLPLNISGTSASMTNQTSWVPDIATGTWLPGPDETAIEAEASSNILANGATVGSCTGCSGSQYVSSIGGPAQGTLTFANISSEVDTLTTIRIEYTNEDLTQRFANVVVNGVGYVTAFLSTPDGETTGVSTLNVPLMSGSENVIVFEGYESGLGPNIDRVLIPVR